MSKTPNKKMIGLFTFMGVVLFLSFMAIFLRDKFFVKDEDLVVLYFDESVKGLSVGAPVVLRGVELGRVVRVNMLVDVDNLVFKTPVYVKIDSTQIKRYDDTRHEVLNRRQLLDRMIERGLRGRLATQNFLTGQLMVELTMVTDDQPAVFKGRNVHLEIPTVISSFGALSQDLQDLPIKESLAHFNDLLAETTKLVDSLNKTIANTGDISGVINNLNSAIKDVGEAARSLNNFGDYIERHPEALIKGKKGY